MKGSEEIKFDRYITLLEHLFDIPCELSMVEHEALLQDSQFYGSLESIRAKQDINWEEFCQQSQCVKLVVDYTCYFLAPVFLGSCEKICWLQFSTGDSIAPEAEAMLKQTLLDIRQCVVNDYNNQSSISGMSQELMRCYEEINMIYGLDEIWRNSHNLQEYEAFEIVLCKSLEHMMIDMVGLLIPDSDFCMYFSQDNSSTDNENILNQLAENIFPILRNTKEALVLNRDKMLQITSGKVDLPYRFLVAGVSYNDKVNSGFIVFAKKEGDDEFVNSDRKICALMAREISKISKSKRDSVTGLLNRESFEGKLDELVSQSHQGPHSLIYIDIDRFQIVNDNWGHAEGDRLLKQVAALISSKLDRDTIISRLGGDEFGVLLRNITGEEAERIAEKLRTAIQEICFISNENVFEISGSFGVVEINSDNVDRVDILSAADLACHVVKDTGKNGVRRYQPGDSELGQHYDLIYWASRIKNSLQEDRFELYGQEIRSLDGDDTGSHFEMLVRLHDKNGKMVSPGLFIPAAERYNLMPLLDRWVLDESLRLLSECNSRKCEKRVSISVNVSGQSLGNDEYLEYIKGAILKSDICPGDLSLEITETSAVANFDRVLEFIREIQEIGCKFSLDDFGSGMSSFGYLKHLPVNYLKIDGVFIRNICNDSIDRVMVDSIHTVAQAMGLKTIAEFVESEETVEVLKDIGIDFAQGYAIDKPSAFREKMNLKEVLPN